MYLKKMAVLAALLIALIANAAHAGVTVWAIADNQTSSSVSLVDSETLGSFGGSGPVSSIAASSAGGGVSYTPGLYESGLIEYGSCTMYWTVYVDYYYVDAYTSASGTNCTATVVGQSVFGYNANVWIRLDIT